MNMYAAFCRMDAFRPTDTHIPWLQLLGENAAKISNFATYLRSVFRTDTDPTTLEVAAATLGHLVQAGGALTADVVEYEVCTALHVVQSFLSRAAAVAKHQSGQEITSPLTTSHLTTWHLTISPPMTSHLSTWHLTISYLTTYTQRHNHTSVHDTSPHHTLPHHITPHYIIPNCISHPHLHAVCAYDAVTAGRSCARQQTSSSDSMYTTAHCVIKSHIIMPSMLTCDSTPKHSCHCLVNQPC